MSKTTKRQLQQNLDLSLVHVPLEIMGQLDDSLADKFGQAQYVMIREQVIDAAAKGEHDEK